MDGRPPYLPMAGVSSPLMESYIERIAATWERAGDWVRANWIRAQAQEIRLVLERGDAWPEVWGG